jgi:hypothetical protein
MPISLHGRRTVVSGLGKRFAYAKTGPKKEASKEGTFGDFLAELKEKSDLKPKTLEGYAAAFRKIVADNIGRHGRGGGAKRCASWRKAVEAIQLAELTPPKPSRVDC